MAKDDRGSVVEFVIAAPTLVLLLLLVVAAFRISDARAEVQAAARTGARAASIASSLTEAESVATRAAGLALEDNGPECNEFSVELDDSSIARGAISVTVVCTVALDDLVAVGLGASQTVSATFVEPVDPGAGW